VALDLVAVLALQAYVEHAVYVCGNMCAGKHNRMSINLEQHVFCKRITNIMADVLLYD